MRVHPCECTGSPVGLQVHPCERTGTPVGLYCLGLGDGPGVQWDCVGVCACVPVRDVGGLGCGFVLLYSIMNSCNKILYSVFYVLYSIFYILYSIFHILSLVAGFELRAAALGLNPK